MAALNKLYYTKKLKQQAFKACLNISTQLLRLKKVYEKVRSKKYHLVKQGLRELEVKEKKKFKVEIAYIVEVGSINTPNPCLLPLSNSLNFDFSFSILPDVISNNIPIPFL